MRSYTNIPTTITPVKNISHSIANPRQGDWMFFDIDELLLKTGFNRFDDRARLTEKSLAADIRLLREVGVKAIGLTARSQQLSSKTLEQLAAAGIELDVVLHAPINSQDQTKLLTKGKVTKEFLLEQAGLGNKPKRMYAFDDIVENLEDIQTALQDMNIPFYGKHYIPAQYQPILINADTNKVFPGNLDGYKVVRPLGGGSQSVFELQHEVSGNRLVIKFGAHEDSAKLEILSNAVYHAMGVAVPKMRVYHTLPKDLATKLGLKSPYGMFKVCEYIGNDQENNSQEKVIKDAASRNFVAHVLMGNIDIAKSDNFIVNTDGVTHLIDAGANFIFRSMGELREEQPELASEIDSLRNKKINHAGAAWFAAINDEEIARQVREIHGRIREIEDAVWHVSNELELTEELRQRYIELLSERLDILTTRFTRRSQAYAKADKKAQVNKTAAGVLSYTMIDNVPHVLLSKRAGHEWWDNFGGKSDAEDKYLIDTARREVKEESNDLLDYSEYKLAASPFHDIITCKRERQFLYRMYIAEHEYVDAALFRDHEHTEHQWVPVSDILRAIKSREVKVFEDKHVKVVQTKNGDIPLYQPLCHMLEQQPVLEQLEMLCHSRTLNCRRTLSYAAEQHTEAKSSYRPLMTVEKKRQDLAVTMLEKNKVLKQVKRDRKLESLMNSKTDDSLSQSELHMAAVLGHAYVANNVFANVELMINQHFNPNISADKKQGLIEDCVRLIKTEKENPELFHFYHGCNSEVSFAYDVYSALYQEIYANDARRAFRIDTTHLKKFKNIIDFIAYYSKGGTEVISNNDADYHECAICTNVFLFGNHGTDTSCSVSYMLNDTVMRDFNLEYMLLQLFKPYHVSPQWVKRLTDLYVKYAKDRKGTLYQIGVAKEHARSMSYPAGFLGVLKKLGDDGDITSVIATLTTEAQDSKSSRASLHYMNNLQARLLASPGLEMNVQQIRVTDANHEQDMQFSAALQQLMGELMYQSHLHADMGNPADERGVCRFYPDILQQNKIPHQKGLTDERLTTMILANDVVRVREVIVENPEILNRKVSIQKNNYMEGNHSSREKSGHGKHSADNNETFSVLDLILLKSGMKAVELGSDFEKIALNHMPSTTDKFIQVMRKISSENRLTYVLKRIDHFNYDLLRDHYGSVNNSAIDDLAIILELLPEQDRMKIYERYAAIIPPYINLNVIKVYVLLPDEVRVKFYETNETGIQTCYRLRIAIGILPIGERLPALAKYEHLLNSTTENNYEIKFALVDIIGLLPENARLDFVVRHHQLIRDSHTLRDLLQAMDPVSCSRFLPTYRGQIDAHCIRDILKCLPESDRYAFALKHDQVIQTSYGVAHWTMVLETLPEADRYNYVKHNEDRLSPDKLIKILGLVPQNYHLELLKNRYKSCAKLWISWEISNIADYINSLPSSIKDPYSEFVREKITDTSISKDKLTQYNKLIYAIYFTANIERMNLVKQYETSITTCEELANLGKLLEHKDYLCLVNRHLDLIHNSLDLHLVTLEMTPASHLDFLLAVVAKQHEVTRPLVNDDKMFDQLPRILTLLSNPDEQKVFLREYLKFPVRNKHNLLHALSLLPEAERFSYFMKNLSTVASHDNLPDLLENVPEIYTMDFCRAYAAVTTSQKILFEILKMLPKEERAAVLVNTQVKFKFELYQFCDNYHEAISSFITLLPEQDQTTFLHSIIPDDDNALIALLQSLPVHDRVHCAIKYIRLVQSVADLVIILKTLNSDEDRTALVTHIAEDLVNQTIETLNLCNISSVIKYLPEQDRISFLIKFTSLITENAEIAGKHNSEYVKTITATLPEADKPVFEAMLAKNAYYKAETKAQPSGNGLFRSRVNSNNHRMHMELSSDEDNPYGFY